jgi:hypothetical protein
VSREELSAASESPGISGCVIWVVCVILAAGANGLDAATKKW